MEGYYLVIDGIRSYFSIKSDVYINFLKQYTSSVNQESIIHKKDFIVLLEQYLDNLLKSINYGENNLNSNRIKQLEYKNAFIMLNLKNDAELFAYDMINIYNLALQSQETDIKLICKN